MSRVTAHREAAGDYRAIFEATGDGVIIRDLNGYIVEVNPAASRLYGYVRPEMIGLHVRTLIHPDDHHLILDNQQSIEAGRTFQSRAVHLRKDGTRFHVEAHGAAFVFKGGPHILTVIRDITESIEAERAVREERQRISRELHDSVTQALFSMTLQTRTSQMMLERAGIDTHGPLAEKLEQLSDLAHGALAEMRALIFELRPEALEEEGLVRALQRHIVAFKARHEIAAELVTSDEPEVSLPVKEALYRIAQEAMQNAVKHAQPERLELHLETRDAAVTLEVRDDGQGFDPNASFPGHLGLKSMRERAERAGGVMWVESQAGVGTRVRVQVPIPVTSKVFAYITHGNRLLVFSHPFQPEAGIQVPAGAVRPHEDPKEAVLREAFEETGLHELTVERFLGEQFRTRSDYGRTEVDHRRFYHLRCHGDPAETWRHFERDPSDGGPPIAFDFFWVELPDSLPELTADHGFMVPRLLEVLQLPPKLGPHH